MKSTGFLYSELLFSRLTFFHQVMKNWSGFPVIFRFADTVVCLFSGIRVILCFLFGIRKTSFIYRFRNMKYFFLTAYTVNLQIVESCITYKIASKMKKIILIRNSLIHKYLPPPTMPDLAIIFSSKQNKKCVTQTTLLLFNLTADTIELNIWLLNAQLVHKRSL